MTEVALFTAQEALRLQAAATTYYHNQLEQAQHDMATELEVARREWPRILRERVIAVYTRTPPRLIEGALFQPRDVCSTLTLDPVQKMALMSAFADAVNTNTIATGFKATLIPGDEMRVRVCV